MLGIIFLYYSGTPKDTKLRSSTHVYYQREATQKSINMQNEEYITSF